MKKSRRLLSDFQLQTYEDWVEEAKSALKGKSYDQLFSSTYEGIQIKPLYRKRDIENLEYLRNEFPGFRNFLRGQRTSGFRVAPWSVSQSLPFPDPRIFNQKLKEELQNGVNSIFINHIDVSDRYRSLQGLFLDSAVDFEDAFADVSLEKLSLHFNSPKAYELLAYLFVYLKHRKIDPKRLSGSFHLRLFDLFLEIGRLPVESSESKSKLVDFFEASRKHFPKFMNLVVDGTLFFESGGNAIQEISYSIALAVEYVKLLIEAGIEPDESCPKFMFKFSIGSNLFIEIAKLRAFRMLWGKVMEEFRVRPNNQKICIYTVTNRRNKSKLDAYVNMLRNTGETFAAVLGGSDFIEVTPFTEPFGSLFDDFSLRNARNTQIVLLEEHNLCDVIDPIGGSWYIESLTFELARMSLDLFKLIESNGGFVNSIVNSNVQRSIKEIAEKRSKNLATRKDILVGTNKFLNPQEKNIDSTALSESDFCILALRRKKIVEEKRRGNILTELLPKVNRKDFASIVNFAGNLGCISELPTLDFTSTKQIERLERIRESAAFETLRSLSDEFMAAFRNTPKAFLVNFGFVSDYRLRSEFAADVFRVGGFEIIESKGSTVVNDFVAEFLSSGAQVAVICSSDALYPTFVSSLVTMLKNANSNIILVIVGLFSKQTLNEKFQTAGIDFVIHPNSDIVDILSKIYILLLPMKG